MATLTHIPARHTAVLTAVAELYIASGEPVSSLAVAQSLAASGVAVSSATVRNTMADLAESGHLEQPHTSAGRIPTALGFRVYVGQLSGGPLANASRLQIESSLAGVGGTQAFLDRSSHVLATLSSGVGVALASVSVTDQLEHVHFSRLSDKQVLAVIVMHSGLVRDRVLSLGREMSALELETAGRFLNENFHGWSVERVRAEIQHRLEQERSEYQKLLSAVEELWSNAVPREQTISVEGVLNLVTAPHLVTSHLDSLGERARLRDRLEALEEKERVIDLLNAYVDAQQESVRVIFDLDEHAPAMQGLVLIAAPAVAAGRTIGAVGVIGPKRMDYENTISAVGYVAQLFDRVLNSANR